MPGLGRLLSEDVRDYAYPMRAVVPRAEEVTERRWRYWWQRGAWLDQGNSGTCVGHAWAHYVEDGPVTHAGTIDPYEIYAEAVLHDPWLENDGPDYDFGTTVRAGAQALQARGLISEYRWAWDAATVIDALLTTGPVVVGTWWYSGMWETDDEGFVHVSGSQDGGHAYLLTGVNLDRGFVRFKNSWGRSWGRPSYRADNSGYAFMTIDDLDGLVRDDGEACLALEVAA